MERTEPVNPERKPNLILRIWLYPNVSTLKVMELIPSLSDYSQHWAAKRSYLITLIALEFFILYRGFHWITNENFKAIIVLIFIIHGLPEFIYSKKIDKLSLDYFNYYKKGAFWAFVIFLVAGIFCMGLFFNDQIGHVPPK